VNELEPWDVNAVTAPEARTLGRERARTLGREREPTASQALLRGTVVIDVGQPRANILLMQLRLRRVPLDLAQTRVRGAGFWAGWRGLSLAVFVSLLGVALLVGWIFAWATVDTGPNGWLLTLGPIAFSALLTTLGLLYFELRAAQRLRQAENALLTGASHNLRTPLTAIRAATQTLCGDGLAPTDREMLLDAVIHETNRLELRIDTLLETARIDFENRPYALERIDLISLLRDILRDVRWSFAVRQGSFAFRVDGLDALPSDAALPEFSVAGDRRAIRILFENLIDNAIKNASDTLNVQLDASRSADVLTVRVGDAGVGFPTEASETLFSGRRPGDTRRRGTGLGLPLSRAIARGHGGELLMSSRGPGLGAEALVHLPASDLPSGPARLDSSETP
jgi:signal transduction histidine kinase